MKDPILNNRYPELADYVILDGPIEKDRIGRIVFCATNRLREFFPILAKCYIEPITLITSQMHGTPFSDYNVGEEYTFIAPEFAINYWYSKNTNTRSPFPAYHAVIKDEYYSRIRPIPIGVEPDKIDTMRDAIDFRVAKYRLHAVMNSATNHGERTPALHFAAKVLDSIVRNTQNRHIQFEQYIQEIRDSEFTLCPPGAGVDTWRMWEALYMGSIPVVKRGPMVEQFAQHGIPMLMYDFPEEIPEIVMANSGKIKPLNSDALQLTFQYWANLIRGSNG